MKPTVLLIDNYDSFTYNLYQYLTELGVHVVVHRNDVITLAEVEKMSPDYIVLSPGPGTPIEPKDVGICTEVMKWAKGRVPLLGVCLGHQLMGHVYGGTITRVPPVHGKTSPLEIKDGSQLFQHIKTGAEVMRYHSLVINADTVPARFTVTATTADGLIMAMEDHAAMQYGVQFHPESIGTPTGKTMLKNFLGTTSEWILDYAEEEPEIVASLLKKQYKRGIDAVDVQFMVEALSDRMVTVPLPEGHDPVFDVCGTGGTGKLRMNISTALAVRLAKDFRIAKHGNRGATGRVGSMDVAEELGYQLCITPDDVRKNIAKTRCAFVYAPAFHCALKPLAPIRKQLGHPTVFNLVGPLLNPVALTAQMIGVNSVANGNLLANACANMHKEALIVHDAHFGLDDVSAGGDTHFWSVQGGIVTDGVFGPEGFLEEAETAVEHFEQLAGTGTLEGNAELTKSLIDGTADSARQTFMALNERVARAFFEIYKEEPHKTKTNTK